MLLAIEILVRAQEGLLPAIEFVAILFFSIAQLEIFPLLQISLFPARNANEGLLLRHLVAIFQPEGTLPWNPIVAASSERGHQRGARSMRNLLKRISYQHTELKIATAHLFDSNEDTNGDNESDH